MNWVIYTLNNPRTNEVRYVGWTTNTRKRLQEHINESRREPKTHKHRWILSLLSIGLRPVMNVIEKGSGEGWAEAECRWIAFYRAQGVRLTNRTVGGDGVVGWGTYEERCAIARQRSATISSEQRSAWGKKGWANKSPEEQLAAIKSMHKTHTRESRSAVTRRWQASRTPEELSAIAKRRDANMSFEKISAARKKGWANMSPEEQLAKIKKVHANQTPERRREVTKKWQAAKSPEERSAIARQRQLAKTAEQRLAEARRAGIAGNKIRWARFRAAREARHHDSNPPSD